MHRTPENRRPTQPNATGERCADGGKNPPDKNPGSEAFRSERLVEKPDLERAEEFVRSGEYFWNSGMFMFLASRILEELSLHAPEVFSACEEAFSGGREDLDFFRLDAAAFGRFSLSSIATCASAFKASIFTLSVSPSRASPTSRCLT